MGIRRQFRSLWSREPLLVVVGAVTALFLFVWPAVDFHLRAIEVSTPLGYNDFGAYEWAIARWQEGGDIYVRRSGSFHGSYLYPPVTLLLFVPFVEMGFHTGAILLGALSLVLLWVGLEAVLRVLGHEPRLWHRLLGLVALFGFTPAARDFKWAQIATLLAALLCFAFYAEERAEGADPGYAGVSGGTSSPRARAAFRLASGALTTLASSFKLFYATAGAHLLRDTDRLVGAFVAALGLAGISIGVFGLEAHRRYLEVLAWGKGWGAVDPIQLWDATATFRPLRFFGTLAMPAKVLLVLGVIGLALAARGDRSAAARRSTFALGVAAVPLCAPQAALQVLTVLLLPAAILFAMELDRADGRPWLPVLAVLLLHLHSPGLAVVLHPPGWLPLGSLLQSQPYWFQPGMYGTFLLVGLAAVRVAEHASLPVVDRSPAESSA